MTKRKINVIYNSYTDKKELYSMAKNQILEIYNSLKKNYLDNKDEKILNIFLNLDLKKDNYFRILFLISLYCSYFHKIKKNIDIKTLSDLQNECYKKYNFYIVDIDNSYIDILKNLSIYFNTDANNLEPITGKILADLNNIEVQLKKKKYN